MSDEKKAAKHTVTLYRRESAAITGVMEVVSFDEDAIVAETELGALVLRGINLHVSRLSLESGELEVDGAIGSLTYEDGASGRGKGSVLTRLFK